MEGFSGEGRRYVDSMGSDGRVCSESSPASADGPLLPAHNIFTPSPLLFKEQRRTSRSKSGSAEDRESYEPGTAFERKHNKKKRASSPLLTTRLDEAHRTLPMTTSCKWYADLSYSNSMWRQSSMPTSILRESNASGSCGRRDVIEISTR